MAKRTTSTATTEAPKMEAPASPQAPAPTFRVGSFEFGIETGIEIPKHIPKAASAKELPFKSMFDKMGHNDHVFIPHRFWTAPVSEGGRGVDPEKLKVTLDTYARTKLGDAFRVWKGKEPDARAAYGKVIVARKKGDPMGTAGNKEFPEDGMSLFVTVETPTE